MRAGQRHGAIRVVIESRSARRAIDRHGARDRVSRSRALRAHNRPHRKRAPPRAAGRCFPSRRALVADAASRALNDGAAGPAPSPTQHRLTASGGRPPASVPVRWRELPKRLGNRIGRAFGRAAPANLDAAADRRIAAHRIADQVGQRAVQVFRANPAATAVDSRDRRTARLALAIDARLPSRARHRACGAHHRRAHARLPAARFIGAARAIEIDRGCAARESSIARISSCACEALRARRAPQRARSARCRRGMRRGVGRAARGQPSATPRVRASRAARTAHDRAIGRAVGDRKRGASIPCLAGGA
ncbi:MAG: hypothetical protein WDW38_006500 [Sanguina aurantia]